MAINPEILKNIVSAQASLVSAAQLLAEPPPTTSIPVKSGDNLKSLITNSPAGSVFDIAIDFTQDMGFFDIIKPVKLQSVGGCKLIGSLFCKAPDIQFQGIGMEGTGGTILTAHLRTKLELCNLVGSLKGQHRGILANSEGLRVTNTKITNIWKDIDTQAIGGAKGSKDIIIDGCELEASGENVMFGGDDPPTESAMPQDILIQNCKLSKPLTWRDRSDIGNKNLFELKAVRNLTMRKCVLEVSFSDAQTGFGIVFTVRNQYGGAPWSTIENVLFEDNIIRHVGSGVSILGRDYTHPSAIMNNVIFKNNKFEDISNKLWGGYGNQVMISGGPRNLQLIGNTFQGPDQNHINSALMFDQPQWKVEGLVVENNEFMEGHYGIFGQDAPGLGAVVLDMYAPGYKWINNKVTKGGIRNIKWPIGTVFA